MTAMTEQDPRLRMPCKGGHDAHHRYFGNHGALRCRACQAETQRKYRASRGKEAGVGSKQEKAAEAAKKARAWVPHLENALPCWPAKEWHQMKTRDQVEACQSCHVREQCLELGMSVDSTGEVWGGVLIGTPDREVPRVAS